MGKNKHELSGTEPVSNISCAFPLLVFSPRRSAAANEIHEKPTGSGKATNEKTTGRGLERALLYIIFLHRTAVAQPSACFAGCGSTVTDNKHVLVRAHI